jgi:hypothetical protein
MIHKKILKQVQDNFVSLLGVSDDNETLTGHIQI